MTAQDLVELALDNTRPVDSASYQVEPRFRQFAATEIDKMIRQDVIKPATAEWASTIVCTPKKGESLHFCANYRNVNAVSVWGSYQLPRMKELIDWIRELASFSKLEKNYVRWTIKIDPGDYHKTAFSSLHGLFQSTRLLFGLSNAPATLQKAMNDILLSGKLRRGLLYLRT